MKGCPARRSDRWSRSRRFNPGVVGPASHWHRQTVSRVGNCPGTTLLAVAGSLRSNPGSGITRLGKTCEWCSCTRKSPVNSAPNRAPATSPNFDLANFLHFVPKYRHNYNGLQGNRIPAGSFQPTINTIATPRPDRSSGGYWRSLAASGISCRLPKRYPTGTVMTRRRPRRFLPSIGIGRDLIEASSPRIADSIGADILHRKRLTAAAVQARGMRVIGPCRRPAPDFTDAPARPGRKRAPLRRAASNPERRRP